MPVERVTMKPSDVRKSNKPIMEKRRRARINNCLNELKSLILEALKKDPSRHSKLEKADILEMTVKHLQNLQRQQVALAVAADTSVLNKYRAGFGECVGEVSRYVSHMEGVDPALRQRLLTHLSQYLKELHRLGDTGMTTPMTIAGLAAAASSSQPLQLQMPTTTTAGLLPGSQIPSLGADPNNLFRGLQLIPTRLPTGEILFLLPSQSLAATAAAAASAAALAPTKLNGPSPTVGVVSSRSSVSIAPSSLGTQLPLSVDVFSSPVSSPEPNPLSASSPSSGCSVIVDNPCSPASAVAQDMTKKLVVTKEELNIPNSSSPSTSSSEFEPLHESAISFASSNSTEVNCDDSASAKDPWRPW